MLGALITGLCPPTPSLQLELTFSYLDIQGVTCSKPAQVSAPRRPWAGPWVIPSPEGLTPRNILWLVSLLNVSRENVEKQDEGPGGSEGKLKGPCVQGRAVSREENLLSNCAGATGYQTGAVQWLGVDL